MEPAIPAPAHGHAHRPRVSRETRRLLVIGAASLVALWMLARIRFPDQAVAANPVSPVLAQLAAPSALDDIARTLTQVQARIAPSLLGVSVSGRRVTALSIRAGVGVALIDIPPSGVGAGAAGPVTARDPASGLAVVRLAADSGAPVPWTPRRPDAPRFLVAAGASDHGVLFWPVFIAGLDARASALWPAFVWMLPPSAGLSPGTFLFTVDGELAGLVVDREGATALVPADALTTLADALLQSPPPPAGHLGITVSAVTVEVGRAAGATPGAGALVTWVDPAGPAAGHLLAADVIERVDERPLASFEDWRAHGGRLAAGKPVVLWVRRGDALHDVTLTPAAPVMPVATPALGLTLQQVHGLGSRVAAVAPGSAGARAGIEIGDVVTRAGIVARPTPLQVRRAFSEASSERPLLVAITRGATHFVRAVAR